MNQRPFEILLVEDSPGDVWLTRETLLQGGVPKNINVVTNGEQALDYLQRRAPFLKAVRPDLVLLDLNLPRRDGLEVLKEIKDDPVLRSITVVILTTSEAPTDVNAAYDLNANCYIVKPVDLESFTQAIRGIEHFWMSMASLPTMGPRNDGKADRADSTTGRPKAETNGPESVPRGVRPRLRVRRIQTSVRHRRPR
jgi:chemotaxis family two-component system response regulator Rcp1